MKAVVPAAVDTFDLRSKAALMGMPAVNTTIGEQNFESSNVVAFVEV